MKNFVNVCAALMAFAMSAACVSPPPAAELNVDNVKRLMKGGAEVSGAFTAAGAVTFSSTVARGACTLDGASPSVCTATVTASSKCVCANVGTSAAIASNGCAVSLSGTTLTVTSANAASNDVNYHCF